MGRTMKKLLCVLLACLLPSLAMGQAYSLFQPANGILKGQTSTFVTTPATSADVISLWTGTCSPTTFLRGDGTCVTPSGAGIGTVTSVGLAWTGSGLTVSNSPVTSAGTLTFSGALNVATGGTGATTLTGLLEGNGTSAIDAAEVADVITLWTGTCNSTTFLRGDGSCQTIAGNTDASTLTSGTLADARLSANVPLKNAVNIFTNSSSNTGALQVSTTAPVYGWVETDAAADEKRYRAFSESGVWSLCTLTDAEGAGACAMAVDRTGTAVSDINLTATAVRANGQAILTATSGLNGTNVTSGTVADARLSATVANYNDAAPLFSVVGNQSFNVANSSTGFSLIGVETNGVHRGDMCSATTAGVCGSDTANDLWIRGNAAPNIRIGANAGGGGGSSIVTNNADTSISGSNSINLLANGVSSGAVSITGNLGVSLFSFSGVNAIQIQGSRPNTIATNGRIAFARVGGAGTIQTSLNVTSVTRNSAGSYTIDLTAAGFTQKPTCVVNNSTTLGFSSMANFATAPFNGIIGVCRGSVSAGTLVCTSEDPVEFNFICHGL